MDQFQSKLMATLLAITLLILCCFPTMSFSISCAIPRKMVARVEITAAGSYGSCRSGGTVEQDPRGQRGYAQGSRRGTGPPSPNERASRSQDGSGAPAPNKQ
ncbi:hypothetical protein J5N97_027657 [Dioscorea zingiberensis]|uniref:Uncharacterized protein n=1 Tax=Dioscorea zingiberensis TaxID=325984 RepID=A0A9D5H3Z5_9LILI|nr:hypothetical protein J5N97_027657 [Dioscorea zingiberensis]